jgi:hypothetical protein
VKLSELSKVTELKKIVLDDEDIQNEFGEAIEFYTWDRQPMDVFMKMATINENNTDELFNVVKQLVLDENGNEIINEQNTIPMNVMLKVINVIVEDLGKL